MMDAGDKVASIARREKSLRETHSKLLGSPVRRIDHTVAGNRRLNNSTV